MFKAIIAAGLLIATQVQALEVVEGEITAVDVSLQCVAPEVQEGVDPYHTDGFLWNDSLVCTFAGSSTLLERILNATGEATPDRYKWACHPNGSRYSHHCVIP